MALFMNLSKYVTQEKSTDFHTEYWQLLYNKSYINALTAIKAMLWGTRSGWAAMY